MRRSRRRGSAARSSLVAACLTALFIVAMFAGGQSAPKSLKDVPVVEPPNLGDFVADRGAAIILGKALFWEMQVGSDGVQACATCHPHGGADNRVKNQLSPGLNDLDFPLGSRVLGDTVPVYPSGDVLFGNSVVPGVAGHPGFGPNYEASADDFPFHQRVPATELVPRPASSDDEFATAVIDTNDVWSSQGVRYSAFVAVVPGLPTDLTTPLRDPVFNVSGRNVRRVEPRNALNVINAAFNFDSFWDGRASSVFNGVNPFGFRDRQSQLMKADSQGNLQPVFIRIPFSSLASQAVGPPVSPFEMSAQGRTFPLLGRKLLSLRPLGLQLVHPQDSVLGPLARARLLPGGGLTPQRGLNTTYGALIRQAFRPEWWSARQRVSADGGATFTQMEWNFSLFFGLAVQLYEDTLIADNTPLDQFLGANSDVRRGGGSVSGDPNALTSQEKLGLDILRGTNISGQNPTLIDGRCHFCHTAPEFTSHTVRNLQVDEDGVPQNIIEVMPMGDGNSAFYDNGTYNVSARGTNEDIGRDGTAPNTAPFINPLTGEPFPLAYSRLALLKRDGLLPADVAQWVPDLPQPNANGFFRDPDTGLFDVPPPANDRVATRGAMKVPTTRGSRFTGPYYHAGGMSTLRQAIEFYARGGNFPATNFGNFDADILGVPGLDLTQDPQAETRIEAVVAFFADALTDERVAFEQAPFDHPQLFVPVGANPFFPGVDEFMEVPAVGADGRDTALEPFLDLDPQTP